MASGADTFPARSTTLWPVMNDEELSMASSSSSSSAVSLATTTSVTTTHQQRLLLPSTSNTQLNELSAFLASANAPSGAQNNTPQTFLDDLLRDDAEGHQQSFPLLQSHGDSGTTTDAGVLSDAAFFSLGEEAHRDQTAAYSSSSSVGSPSTPSAGANTSRLLQLETNYERKKKRAKINRKDLNSRFQELMDILHLKEDRKLNRAKILEKTIEHIEKLTAELNALKTGQPAQQQGLKQMHHAAPRKTAIGLQLQNAMAQSMAQQPFVNQVRNNAVGGTPLLPYAPHAWNTSVVGTNLPLAPMMWMPCPVVTSSGMMLKRAAPGRPGDTSSRKRGRVESVESVTTTISEPVSNSSEVEGAEVAVTSSSTSEPSIFEWTAQEIPTILSYCDAWTLVSVMGTSRDLRNAARRDTLWADLCRSRWRLSSQIDIPRPVEQWQKDHAMNRIPDCANFTSGGQLFACGRANSISVWGMLSHRSNGHTTRTVLQNGKATVMQVVELFIVVQNLSQDRVQLTDCISLTSKTSPLENGDTNSTFQPFTTASGAHLMPTVVAVNSESCVTKNLTEIALHHGDLCVLSVFMACPGLELEDQFLQRAGTLNLQFQTNSQDRKYVKVHATCMDHNNYDRTREKAMLAVRQG
ncbi:hypothetical protein DVH05_000376 [Phytophthora capsici]|nr:hypothetical protein DVH05_000376 [Phytophthora capsici]